MGSICLVHRWGKKGRRASIGLCKTRAFRRPPLSFHELIMIPFYNVYVSIHVRVLFWFSFAGVVARFGPTRTVHYLPGDVPVMGGEPAQSCHPKRRPDSSSNEIRESRRASSACVTPKLTRSAWLHPPHISGPPAATWRCSGADSVGPEALDPCRLASPLRHLGTSHLLCTDLRASPQIQVLPRHVK